MGEALSLIAAVVSAVTGVIATAISVAQWRESHPRATDRGADRPESPRSTFTRTPPAAPPPAVPPPEARRASRSLAWALVLAAVCCFFTAVSQFSYWNELREVDVDSGWETFYNTTGLTSGFLSIVGIPLAVVAAGVALHRRRGRDFRLAVLALLGCLTPWIGLWIINVINDQSAAY
jgi:uncharacterized membrane protein YhaH (DUF805 family)